MNANNNLLIKDIAEPVPLNVTYYRGFRNAWHFDRPSIGKKIVVAFTTTVSETIDGTSKCQAQRELFVEATNHELHKESFASARSN